MPFSSASEKPQDGQDWLIKLAESCGYQSNADGVCFGIAYMALQAILSDDYQTFYNRLSIMSEVSRRIKEGGKIDQNNLVDSLSIMLNDIRRIHPDFFTSDYNSEIATDIAAMLEGIDIHFQPNEYKHLFESTNTPVGQSPKHSIPLVSSIALTDESGQSKIKHVSSCSGMYDEKSLKKYIKNLEKITSSSKDKSTRTGFIITSIDHAICVTYIPALKKWKCIEPNQLSLANTLLSNQELATLIHSSLSNSNKIEIKEIAIATTMYASNANQNWLSAHNQLNKSRACKIDKKNANITDSNGATWLRLAVECNEIDTVNALLKKGGSIETADDIGFTPLLLAAYEGRKEIVELLLANKANPNAKSTSGYTALHYAVSYGYIDIVKLLLANGADLNLKTKAGQSPMDIAVEKNRSEIAKLLTQEQVKRLDPNDNMQTVSK